MTRICPDSVCAIPRDGARQYNTVGSAAAVAAAAPAAAPPLAPAAAPVAAARTRDDSNDNKSNSTAYVTYKWRQICRNTLVAICSFDLENVGQGYKVRLSQWLHSI